MDALTSFLSTASRGFTESLSPPTRVCAVTAAIKASPSTSASLLATTYRAIDAGLLTGDSDAMRASVCAARRRIFLASVAGAGATTDTGATHGSALNAAAIALEEVVRVRSFPQRPDE